MSRARLAGRLLRSCFDTASHVIAFVGPSIIHVLRTLDHLSFKAVVSVFRCMGFVSGVVIGAFTDAFRYGLRETNSETPSHVGIVLAWYEDGRRSCASFRSQSRVELEADIDQAIKETVAEVGVEKHVVEMASGESFEEALNQLFLKYDGRHAA